MKTAKIEIDKSDFSILMIALTELLVHMQYCEGCLKIKDDTLNFVDRFESQLRLQNRWVQEWSEAGEYAEQKTLERTH